MEVEEPIITYPRKGVSFPTLSYKGLFFMRREFILEACALVVACICLLYLGALLDRSMHRPYAVGQAVPSAMPYDKPLCMSLYAKPNGEPAYRVATCPVVPR